MVMLRPLLSATLAASLLSCAEPAPLPPVAPPSAPSASAAPSPRACTFGGLVRSDSGAPVPGALVAVSPPGADPTAFARADHEGRYCVEGLTAGDYGFTVTAPRLTSVYVDVRTIAVGDTIDVALGGPGFVLRGRAVDDQAAPLAGSKLYVPRISDFLADCFVTETDAEGRFEIKLPAGRYSPSAHSERHVSAPMFLDLDKDLSVDIKAARQNPAATPAPEEVVAWIQSSAAPLKTVSAGQGLDDMMPLQAMIGKADIVALGEATHGTREFFQLKHRVLELLVEKMGFRSFAIEASFPDCLPLTEYVRTGKGDPAAALANQRFWTWDTEEVLEMVRWMRRYNEDPAHREKLTFWGFDMQFPTASAAAVLAHLRRVDPALEKEVAPALSPVSDDFSAGQLGGLSEAARTALLGAVKKVSEKLAEAPAGKKVSEVEQRILRIHGRVIAAAVHQGLSRDGSLRDRVMADITADLVDIESLRGPAKVVLWAHNGHISKRHNGGSPSMGAHLHQRFGARYFTFGFAFDEGSFQAVDAGPEGRGLVPFTVGSGAPGSLDHTLARAGLPLFALDLRGAPPGPAREWLSAASQKRELGSMFAPNVPDYGLSPVIAKDHYDALFFVQKTTAARPNETGKRGRGDAKKPAPPRIDDPGFEAAKVGETPSAFRVTSSPKQLVYKGLVSDKGCAGGKRCLTVSRVGGDVPIGIGTAATRIDATPHRGKKITVRARARVAGKAPGDKAFFFAAAPGKSFEEKLVWAAVPGPGWAQVSVEVEVPKDGEEIMIALAVTGGASGGLDDIEVP